MPARPQRYSRPSRLNKLPKWITQYIDPAHKALSSVAASTVVRTFLKQMAQPRSQASPVARLRGGCAQHRAQNEDVNITMLNEAGVRQRLQQMQVRQPLHPAWPLAGAHTRCCALRRSERKRPSRRSV